MNHQKKQGKILVKLIVYYVIWFDPFYIITRCYLSKTELSKIQTTCIHFKYIKRRKKDKNSQVTKKYLRTLQKNGNFDAHTIAQHCVLVDKENEVLRKQKVIQDWHKNSKHAKIHYFIQ